MSAPRVTIGLPVFNGERYLGEALEAILDQRFTDFELIISDNASSDATPEICRRFGRDRRITYVRQEHNLGAAPNFNLVFRAARAPLFMWAAHDDRWHPDYLRACVAMLDLTPQAVLCQTGVRVIDEHGFVLKIVPPFHHDAGSPHVARRFRATIRNPQCYEVFGVIRTAALRNSVLIGSYIGMDRTLLAQLALRGPFALVSEPLFDNRLHPARASQITKTRTRHELAAIYDTANAGHVVMSEWHHYGRTLALIAREAPGLRTKARCAAALLAQLGRSWDGFFLALEPLMLIDRNILEHATALKRALGRACRAPSQPRRGLP